MAITDQLRRMRSVSRNTLATTFLVAACLIASRTYTSDFLWLFKREHSYLPDLVSGISAVLLVWPLIRGDFLYTHRLDAQTIINLALVFYLTAVFVTIGLGGDSILLKGPTFAFAAIVIILSNLNASRYGELAIIALAVFGGVNLLSASVVMGFWGFALSVCSALGVLFTVDVEKALKLLLPRRSSA